MAGICSRHSHFDPSCRLCSQHIDDRYGRTRDSIINEVLEKQKKADRRMTMIVHASVEHNKCGFHGKNRNPHCEKCGE
jgi:hypothetical protein